jgi:hypothetical protein
MVMRMTHPQEVNDFLNEISRPTPIVNFLKPFHLVILGIQLKRTPKKLKFYGGLETYAHNIGLYELLTRIRIILLSI